MSKIGDALRATLKAVDQEKILTPIFLALLHDPKFKGFTIEVEGWKPRPYDGKFHPSSHAEWSVRQLFLYLTAPESMRPETMDLQSVLAITQGKFWHTFLQKLWLDHGILQLDEVPLADPRYNLVGHMDGLLTTMEGLEIKTINDFQLPKITDAASLKEKKPGHYAQTQDYLMISGLTAMRYFMIAMSMPYPTQEFVVEFDEEFQLAQQRKYRAALDAAAELRLPQSCCTPRSPEAKECPVRGACDIGRLR